MPSAEPYEIYAVRYARHERRAGENFLGGDPHDGPMPIDYFVWAILGRERSFIVDTGFDETQARQRKRTLLRPPGEGLKALGVDPGKVTDVIITHMHYDHAGNHDLFPEARYHLQEREMQYCTGRCMCHGAMRHSFELDDVTAMLRRLYAGRLQFHDGSEELATGVSVHLVGGHTMGLQVVRVWTERGWVVLASDAMHLYANMEQGRPYPIIYNLGDMMDGWGKARALASSPRHVVPGHDPLVLERYPAARPGLEGVVRLDLEPAA